MLVDASLRLVRDNWGQDKIDHYHWERLSEKLKQKLNQCAQLEQDWDVVVSVMNRHMLLRDVIPRKGGKTPLKIGEHNPRSTVKEPHLPLEAQDIYQVWDELKEQAGSVRVGISTTASDNRPSLPEDRVYDLHGMVVPQASEGQGPSKIPSTWPETVSDDSNTSSFTSSWEDEIVLNGDEPASVLDLLNATSRSPGTTMARGDEAGQSAKTSHALVGPTMFAATRMSARKRGASPGAAGAGKRARSSNPRTNSDYERADEHRPRRPTSHPKTDSHSRSLPPDDAINRMGSLVLDAVDSVERILHVFSPDPSRWRVLEATDLATHRRGDEPPGDLVAGLQATHDDFVLIFKGEPWSIAIVRLATRHITLHNPQYDGSDSSQSTATLQVRRVKSALADLHPRAKDVTHKWTMREGRSPNTHPSEQERRLTCLISVIYDMHGRSCPELTADGPWRAAVTLATGHMGDVPVDSGIRHGRDTSARPSRSQALVGGGDGEDVETVGIKLYETLGQQQALLARQIVQAQRTRAVCRDIVDLVQRAEKSNARHSSSLVSEWEETVHITHHRLVTRYMPDADTRDVDAAIQEVCDRLAHIKYLQHSPIRLELIRCMDQADRNATDCEARAYGEKTRLVLVAKQLIVRLRSLEESSDDPPLSDAVL